MTRVLVVEDNDEVRQATVEMLSGHGIHAWGVTCAEEVDEFDAVIRPDVYVLDLGLPGEDGLTLAQRLRKAQPRVGIVMLTARANVESRVAGYGHGADVYLPKPTGPEELLAVIAALSKRIERERGTAVGLEVYADQLLLKGPSGEQRLTQRECLLLSALARASDQMLERWQVLQLLDPDEKGLSAESMAMCVGQLRKKIISCDESLRAQEAVIKAVRGTGYRLLAAVRLL